MLALCRSSHAVLYVSLVIFCLLTLLHLLLYPSQIQATLVIPPASSLQGSASAAATHTRMPSVSEHTGQHDVSVVMLPWERRNWGKHVVLPPDEECTVAPSGMRCRFVPRSLSNASLADVLVIDSNGKMREDMPLMDMLKGRHIDNGRKVRGVLWNYENWVGRAREWGSKYRTRWLNRSTESNPSFWGAFDFVASFESTADLQVADASMFASLQSKVDAMDTFRFPLRRPKKLLKPLALFIASNCFTKYPDGKTTNKTARHRDDRVKLLMESLRGGLAAYGQCLNNRATMEDRGCQNMKHFTKLCMIQRHRFYIAFENSVYPDYVTEKVYEALAAGTVPVYFGAPNVENYLPTSHAIINSADFASMRELAAYMECVARNSTLYAHYANWRERSAFASWKAHTDKGSLPLCRLCAELWRRDKDALRTAGLPPTPTSDVLAENRHSQVPLECS